MTVILAAMLCETGSISIWNECLYGLQVVVTGLAVCVCELKFFLTGL